MPSECWLYTSIGSTTIPRMSSAFSAVFSNYLESSVPPVPIRSRFCSKDQTPPRSLKRWRCCSSISITKSPACLTVVRPSPSTCSTLTRSPHLLTFYYRSSEASVVLPILWRRHSCLQRRDSSLRPRVCGHGRVTPALGASGPPAARTFFRQQLYYGFC